MNDARPLLFSPSHTSTHLEGCSHCCVTLQVFSLGTRLARSTPVTETRKTQLHERKTAVGARVKKTSEIVPLCSQSLYSVVNATQKQCTPPPSRPCGRSVVPDGMPVPRGRWRRARQETRQRPRLRPPPSSALFSPRPNINWQQR